KKIGLVRSLGRRRSPAKSLVLRNDIDETLRPRVVVSINQHCGHVADLARFKSVTEEQSEKRRQNEQQKQHAPVPINVEKLLIRDAGDGVNGRFHNRIFSPIQKSPAFMLLD